MSAHSGTGLLPGRRGVRIGGELVGSGSGYYWHDGLVRAPDGWQSRSLREESIWFTSPPASNGQPGHH